MIAKSSIEAYINQELEDWRWVKDLKHEDMKAEIKSIAHEKFRFKTKPYEHQLACILLGIYNRQFLFLVDMGGGKSKIVLDVLNYHRLKKRIKKTLILVPSPVNIHDFAEQVHIHSRIPCIELVGNRVQRLEMVETFRSGVAIINYAGLMSTICDVVDHRMTMIPNNVQTFVKSFDSVVFDETHMAKNSNSLTYRLCHIISRKYAYRYGLTGTPMGRDPMDLWAQFKLIDDGETLGKHITMFRNAFFKTKQNYWGGFEYLFDKSKTEALNSRIANKSIRYDTEEMVSLPKLNRLMQRIILPWENSQAYDEAIDGLIHAKGDKVEIDNIFIRLRQISSGYLAYNYEGDRVVVDFKYNPKIEALMTLVDSMPGSCKAIIVHEFIHSGVLIEEALKKRKIKFVHLWGGTKDKSTVIGKFRKDANCKVFVMNWRSGSMGINLQNANYMFFYESPVGPIARAQTEKRVYRTGQRKHTYIYDFSASKIEDKIQAFLKDGKNLFKELIVGRVSAKDLK